MFLNAAQTKTKVFLTGSTSLGQEPAFKGYLKPKYWNIQAKCTLMLCVCVPKCRNTEAKLHPDVVCCMFVFVLGEVGGLTKRHCLDSMYRKTSMAQTLMACIPCLARTHFWVPVLPYMGYLWSNFCIYVFLLFFSFSVFSDRQLL